MKPLQPIPLENLISHFDNILANKEDAANVAILKEIRDDIEIKYCHYIENFDSEQLINIENSTYPINHPALLSCYKSEGAILIALKKAIWDLQDVGIKGTCQYCDIGKPKSFDHYLPIGQYPEYSVLAINLIPCCKDCNGKKSSYWKADGIRGILNFYVDNIPNTLFLYGDVRFVENIPCVKFKIENVDNIINEGLFSIIENHFNRLDLIKTYDSEATDELGELYRIFVNYIDNTTILSMKNKLLDDAAQLQQQFGVNYWKAIIRISLANSADYLVYITDKINNN